jgi:diaminopimelate decarboxylase
VGEGILSARRAPRLRPTAGGYRRHGGSLWCEGVPLDAVARAAATPTFVYSAGAIRTQYAALDTALAAVPHRIHYSVKASSSLGLLALLREAGAGVDIVSGGELHRALRAGFSGGDIVFSGVGKTTAELREALDARVKLVNVESVGELRRLSAVAVELGRRAPVALRVNPEVTVDTPHPYTRTGMRGMKFGIPHDLALDAGRLALDLPGIDLLGLDMHIGSQIQEVEPYRDGAERLLTLAEALRAAGAGTLEYLDVGGGLAVSYDDEAGANIDAFATTMTALVRRTGLELIVEPGRYLVGNAGVLLSRVIDRKHSGGKEYVVVDAGMNDLLRPSHYNAFHRIEAVTPRGSVRETVDVVGPVCESGDFLALDRELDALAPGDLVAVRSAGAYGYAMSSNYNSRPRAAEVLVDGDRFAIITARESYADLTRLETTAPDWRDV